MGNTGNYIYSGFIPLVKTGFTILAGFALTKKGLFPPAASRGASHLSMTIGLPCLIFASVVPAFNSDNIRFLGPLCLSAAVYQASGLVLGFIIRELFYVPVDFRYGILIATTFSNWGNLPTAVVQTITTQEPFNPKTDPTLGVAYVSVFMLIYSLTFFGIGTCKICAWDFAPRPEGEVTIRRREKWANRRRGLGRLAGGLTRREKGKHTPTQPDSVPEMGKAEGKYEPEYDIEKKACQEEEPRAQGYVGTGGVPEPILSRYRSHQDVIADAYFDGISLAPVSSNVSRATVSRTDRDEQKVDKQRRPPSVHHEEDEEHEPIPNNDVPGPQSTQQLETAIQTRPPSNVESTDTAPKPIWLIVLASIWSVLNPVSISLFIALPIALVTPLKSLFVVVDGWTGTKMPNGPDGKPPLSFLLDTATFIGAITIPVGLMLLGASFARLKVPRPWSRLPIAAILAVMVAKMVIVPVIGVSMTQGLSNHTSLYPKDQRILRFVAMLLSGTPSAVNQLVITQIYSPDGSADTLSMFLIVQYIFMFIASAALAAIGLAFVSP